MLKTIVKVIKNIIVPLFVTTIITIIINMVAGAPIYNGIFNKSISEMANKDIYTLVYAAEKIFLLAVGLSIGVALYINACFNQNKPKLYMRVEEKKYSCLLTEKEYCDEKVLQLRI